MSNLNSRELATVLAALRYWQRNTDDGVRWIDGPFADIATGGDAFPALSDDEINTLCERMNETPEYATPAEVEAACEMYDAEEIAIDEPAGFSRGDDGAWVRAWVFVGHVS